MDEATDHNDECTLPGCTKRIHTVYTGMGRIAILCEKHSEEYDEKLKPHRVKLMDAMFKEAQEGEERTDEDD